MTRKLALPAVVAVAFLATTAPAHAHPTPAPTFHAYTATIWWSLPGGIVNGKSTWPQNYAGRGSDFAPGCAAYQVDKYRIDSKEAQRTLTGILSDGHLTWTAHGPEDHGLAKTWRLVPKPSDCGQPPPTSTTTPPPTSTSTTPATHTSSTPPHSTSTAPSSHPPARTSHSGTVGHPRSSTPLSVVSTTAPELARTGGFSWPLGIAASGLILGGVAMVRRPRKVRH